MELHTRYACDLFRFFLLLGSDITTIAMARDKLYSSPKRSGEMAHEAKIGWEKDLKSCIYMCLEEQSQKLALAKGKEAMSLKKASVLFCGFLLVLGHVYGAEDLCYLGFPMND